MLEVGPEDRSPPRSRWATDPPAALRAAGSRSLVCDTPGGSEGLSHVNRPPIRRRRIEFKFPAERPRRFKVPRSEQAESAFSGPPGPLYSHQRSLQKAEIGEPAGNFGGTDPPPRSSRVPRGSSSLKNVTRDCRAIADGALKKAVSGEPSDTSGNGSNAAAVARSPTRPDRGPLTLFTKCASRRTSSFYFLTATHCDWFTLRRQRGLMLLLAIHRSTFPGACPDR